MVDNIPVGSFSQSSKDGEKVFTRGFPVGFITPGKKGEPIHNLNNHLRIIVMYHEDEEVSEELGEPTSKIVGFRVEPMSIKHSYAGDNFVPGVTELTTCSSTHPPVHDPRNFHSVNRGAEDSVIFTYDVAWEKSEIEWSERWDVYLSGTAPSENVHWFSISNSFLIVLFLSVMIAVILLRALRTVSIC